MRVHYDLAKAPATHDFLYWLARVEQKRAADFDEELEINIIPGQRKQSIRDLSMTDGERAWRARVLLPQLAWLNPYTKNVTWHHLGIQTVEHSPLSQSPGVVLKATEHAREVVKGYLYNKLRPVSITIRNSSFQPERNGSGPEWTRVAAWLWSNGFSPIFVPDTEMLTTQSAQKIYPHDSYYAASFNSDLRLALYEHCELNLMTCGGPMMLALLGHTKTLAFKAIVPGIATCSPEYMAKNGFSPAAEWAPGKRVFWGPDDHEGVIAEAEKVLFADKAKAA